jgi:Spy/CpxP family protein refolding chaperone
MPAPPKAARVSRPKRVPSKADDFAGLNLTDDQKAKIEQVHQSMKRRRDAMVKDEKLTADQRDAMLEGYERMERGQVFELLTTEQRKEVRERIRARHAAEQVEQKKQSPPK